MARVVIENLTKIFPGSRGKSICAVDNASLTIEDKEFLVLVGPSGCGKTTTLRMIAGLEEATSGTISIDDQILNDVPPKDRNIAMVFQNHALYPHMSAYENLAFGLKLRRLSRSEIDRRVSEAAEMLELSACLSRLPAALSGGERQRVALGRAIVRQPKVFLFDEPLSNLDAPMRLQLRAEIARLHQRLASTMIYVTHDQHEAMTLGGRIAVMRQGVIQQVAKPLQLYQHPTNLFVAGFIGSPPMNLFHGILLQDGKACFFQEQSVEGKPAPKPMLLQVPGEDTALVQRYIGKRVVMGIRPEDIVDICDQKTTSPDQVVEALIELVEPTGPEVHLHLASSEHRFIARTRVNLEAGVNQKIAVAFQMDKASLFDAATEEAIA